MQLRAALIAIACAGACGLRLPAAFAQDSAASGTAGTMVQAPAAPDDSADGDETSARQASQEAQEAQASHEAAAAQQTAPPDSAPTRDAAAPTALEDSSTPAGAAPQAANLSAVSQLRVALRQVEEERAHTSNLLPWLTVGVGAGAVVVSSLAGAVHALTCDDGCATPNWVAFTVVAGGLAGVLGTLWLIHANADIRQLESRRYQLQYELERFDHASLRLERALPRSGAALTLRFRL